MAAGMVVRESLNALSGSTGRRELKCLKWVGVELHLLAAGLQALISDL